MDLAYVILYVRDVAAALAFYEDAFGLKQRFLHESGLYGELATGGTTLAFAEAELASSNLPGGFQRADPNRPPGASEIGLATGDVLAAYQRALFAGAQSVSEPKTKPWGQTVAYVRDLDGHLIELCTPMG